MSQSQNSSDTLSSLPLPRIEVYTDGGCDPNPGPGGWGTIIRWGQREWVLSGNDPDTTNNRMELYAAAAALALLAELLGPCQVSIHTDSEYLHRGITEWLEGWIRHDWRTSDGGAVRNQDLWRVLRRLTLKHDVVWHWLKGHTGHPLNERADRLATGARRRLQRVPGATHVSNVSDDSRPVVAIYVKASCRAPQGPGGWAAVLRSNDRSRSISGKESVTTANAMLIRAATEALQALRVPCRVTVHSDASYLVKGASLWVKSWHARGWRTREGKPVANQAEWRSLLEAARPHDVTWIQIQGDVQNADLAWAGQLAAEAASQ